MKDELDVYYSRLLKRTDVYYSKFIKMQIFKELNNRALKIKSIP